MFVWNNTRRRESCIVGMDAFHTRLLKDLDMQRRSHSLNDLLSQVGIDDIHDYS